MSIARRYRLGTAAAALAICAVLAGITASTASAADVNVNPFRCDVFQGGQLTVDAGSTITIRSGVGEQTLGILTAYLNAQGAARSPLPTALA